MKHRNAIKLVALFGAILASSIQPVSSQDPIKQDADRKSVVASTDVSGPEEFQRYCALCHGADGRGAGPLTDADAMKKSAADLTQIAKRNNGSFPFTKIADTIRDGGAIAGHTPSRMLAWGKVFGAEGNPVRAKAIIFEVTRYVESLQEK